MLPFILSGALSFVLSKDKMLIRNAEHLLSLSLIPPCLVFTNLNNVWNFVLWAIPVFTCLLMMNIIVKVTLEM